MNQVAIDFIKAHEELKLEAYQDSGGVWTIGWGHTHNVVRGMICTEPEAEVFLQEDMAPLYPAVKKWSGQINLTTQQEAAILSLSFNVGSLSKSLLMTYVRQRAFISAAKEFPKWDHDGKTELRGLLIRRYDEAALFLRGS